MVFSAEDHILIEALRQEKGHGAKSWSPNFLTSTAVDSLD